MTFMKDEPVIVEGFRQINEIFKAGAGQDLIDLVSADGAIDNLRQGEANIDVGIPKDSLAHFAEDWLGEDAWFGDEGGKALHDAFVHAMTISDGRPITTVWVPSVRQNGVLVSVVDGPATVQVIVTSPDPKQDASGSSQPGVKVFGRD